VSRNKVPTSSARPETQGKEKGAGDVFLKESPGVKLTSAHRDLETSRGQKGGTKKGGGGANRERRKCMRGVNEVNAVGTGQRVEGQGGVAQEGGRKSGE